MRTPSQDYRFGNEYRVVDKNSWYDTKVGTVITDTPEHVRLDLKGNGDLVWFHKEQVEQIPIPYYVVLHHDTERWTVSVPKEVYDEILQTYFPSEEDDTE